MAKTDLQIVVGATDRASGVLRGIGNTLGGLAKGVALAGIGAATAGIAGLGVVLKQSIAEASAAQEVQAQLGAVLKSTGGIAGVTANMANDLADSLSKVTRYEDEAILSTESLLLTFTNIGKDIFPATTEATLDMATALGTDTKSAAVLLGKALNDPIKGVTALTRVGVKFTEAQRAQIKTLVESGNVMEAQKLILRELAVEFGGSARAAGQTLAGQMDILRNSIGNVKESIGNALLPGLTELATALGPVLIKAAEGFGEWLAQAGPKFATFAKEAGAVATAISQFGLGSPQALQALSDLLGEDWALKIQGFGKAMETIGGWLKTHIPPAVAIGKEQLLSFKTDALDAIAKGAEVGAKWLGDLKTALGLTPEVSGWSGIAGTFRDIAEAIERANDALSTWISRANEALGKLAEGTQNLGGLLGGAPVGGLNLPGVPGYVPPGSQYGRPGFAGGSIWSPGGMALVGERGPELVMLPRGGRVFNADQTRDRAGGRGNITVNVYGATNPQRTAQQVQAGVLRAAHSLGMG